MWNWPGSSLDGMFRFWPNTSGPEASWCARIVAPSSGRTEPTRYQFPLSDSVVFFHRWPGSYLLLCKTSLGLIRFGWLCQVLAKRIQSGSKPVCKNHLSPVQANASEPIKIKCESDLACLLGKSKLLVGWWFLPWVLVSQFWNILILKKRVRFAKCRDRLQSVQRQRGRVCLQHCELFVFKIFTFFYDCHVCVNGLSAK